MPALRKVALLMLLSAPLAVSAQNSIGNSSSDASIGPEISDVIARYAKRSGKKFIIDPRVRGLPVLAGLDADKMTYEQILAMLTVNQYVAIPQGDFVIVAPDAIARQQPTPVYTDANFKAADDEWVTLLISPKNSCTGQLVPVLRPLMPQAGHLAADYQSNTLVASDRAINIRRLAQIVERLDRAAPANQRCAGDKKD